MGGCAAAVDRLHVPRPVSGWLSSNDRDGVAVVLVVMRVVVVVIIELDQGYPRCSPLIGQQPSDYVAMDGAASIATLPLAERLLK